MNKKTNTGQFSKGNVPWNKGKRFHAGGRSMATRFKPGHQPANYKPVGTIRTNVEGYLEIKIAEGLNQWRLLHRETWKQHHGSYPPRGQTVIFKDGNKQNATDIANLQMVSRQDLMKKNSVHNLPQPIKEVLGLQRWIKRKINADETKL